MELSSEAGKGTEALFTVRARKLHAVSSGHAARNNTSRNHVSQKDAPVPRPMNQGRERKDVKVLVVEDNLINQKIAVKNVKKLGFEVDAASNGKEALDLLKNTVNDPDGKDIGAVLMDVQMPLMDGYEATKELRRLGSEKENGAFSVFKHLPIIALTASAISGDREKAIAAGMNSYLVKPLDVTELERTLVEWTVGRDSNIDLHEKPGH